MCRITCPLVFFKVLAGRELLLLFADTTCPSDALNSSAVLRLENKFQITRTPTLSTQSRGGLKRNRLQRARDGESTSTVNFSPGICMTISCPLHPSQSFLHGSRLHKVHSWPALIFSLHRVVKAWCGQRNGLCCPGPRCDLRNLPSHRGGSAGTVKIRWVGRREEAV